MQKFWLCQKKEKNLDIVCFTTIRMNAILDTNVLICMDEDIAYIKSMNIKPRVWTTVC